MDGDVKSGVRETSDCGVSLAEVLCERHVKCLSSAYWYGGRRHDGF